MLRHLTLIAVLGLVWPAAANAQSLAELAKKTEKKKDEKESSETITAEDLRRARGSRSGNVSPPRSTTASSATEADSDEGEAGEGDGGEGEEEKSPAEQREEARADWSQRLTDAEAEVIRLEGQVAELEQSLANPGVGSVEQRQRRTEQLATARTDLVAARQNVTALQREGRQNGYQR